MLTRTLVWGSWRAPTGDVRALGEVLADSSVGGFDVRALINRPTGEVAQEIEGFFEQARLSDLLLLYISGHGVLSPTRRLYFATTSTNLKYLRATAIRGRPRARRDAAQPRAVDACYVGLLPQRRVR